MFQKIKDTVDLVEHIVAAGVELRNGNPMMGRCPLPAHEDKSPSFAVYPNTASWHCFGCHENGTVIDFEMHMQSLSAVEAAKFLCEKYQIVVTKEETERYVFSETQRKHKADLLAQIPVIREQRPDSMEYLRKERGFSDATIEAFDLGVGVRENTIIVPIRDKYGRVIAFAKRYLDYETTKGPKWVNDPESELYQKKKVLYNFDAARRELKKVGRLVIVESYFDVCALWEAGIKTGIAYCGSRMTPEQVQEIKAAVEPGTTIVFSACNDEPAQEQLMVNRMLIRSACPDTHIRAIEIPNDCKDLNDVLIKHGKEKLAELSNSFKAMDQYILERVLDREPVMDQQYRKAKEVIGIAENPMSQQDMISYLADRWSRDKSLIEQYMLGKSPKAESSIEFKNITMLAADYEKEIRESAFNRISFGWPKYDEITRKMKPGDVIQFIARSGTGKTMFAQQLMLNIGVGQPHIPMISYSLEQRGVMAFERYMMMDGALKATEVEKWLVAGEDAHNQKIFNTSQSLSKKLANLLICDQGGLTLQQIEHHTKQAGLIYFGHPVRIIFIDYLGYLKWEGQYKSLYELVSLIAREQKEMAKRLNCVVVSLHQITKAGKPGEEIMATHARDSGAVEDSADIMIGAWRPELKADALESEKDSIKGVWRTKFLKNRYGPEGVVVDFNFIAEHLRLRPRDKEDSLRIAIEEGRIPGPKVTLPSLMDNNKAGGASK